MYAKIEKPKVNGFSTKRLESWAIANAITQNKSSKNQSFSFLDNRPETVVQRRVQTIAIDSAYQLPQLKENIKSNEASDSSTTEKGVFQRKIIENNAEIDKDAILDDLVKNIKGRIHGWLTGDGMTSTLKNNSQDVKKEIDATKSNIKATKYLDENLRVQVSPILTKYDTENKTFDDRAHLESQLIQDVKLGILRLNDIIGIDYHGGQFSKTDTSGRGKVLRIYRTTTLDDWNNYLLSNSVAGLLHGHGGSLGQALDYFYKSKNSDKKGPFYNNVIFELKFTKTALNAIDYDEISLGGEGKGPKSGKLTGKKERNDILGEANIFSVNLGACKDLIMSMNPIIRRVDEG